MSKNKPKEKQNYKKNKYIYIEELYIFECELLEFLQFINVHTITTTTNYVATVCYIHSYLGLSFINRLMAILTMNRLIISFQ